MEFYHRAPGRPRRLGVLAGSFNPPTVAHLALAAGAASYVDEVLCVVPSAFPHKEYFGATLEQRIEMLESLDPGVPYSIAATPRGLFIDIATECQEHFGEETRISILCGRDAAERIINWDYGRPGVVEEMLSRFELLVAAREGGFQPPPEFSHRIHPLVIPPGHDQVSSTEVRRRIAQGEPWEHLVAEAIVEQVREIYS